MKNNRSALIAGATGLVGGHVLKLLLASPHYDEVIAVTRKQIKSTNAKLRQIVGSLGDAEEAVASAHVQTTDAFCALGTTIKVAGSQEAFRKVDFDYVVKFARAAKAAGATRFMLVSAIGAAPLSKIFYSRIKGETEQALSDMGFEALHIFRPGLLLGDRADTRAGESMMMKLTPLLNPLLIRRASVYKSIDAEVVAAAMVAAAESDVMGRHVYAFDEMVKLAR
ncbi:MAG: NAD(P)H-binding protein [Parvibaculum sp.]|nr:NAD(P)H-binding protein [Parvibaculum sp.]